MEDLGLRRRDLRTSLAAADCGRASRVRWYGRGPHESYPDRKAGARVGLALQMANFVLYLPVALMITAGAAQGALQPSMLPTLP